MYPLKLLIIFLSMCVHMWRSEDSFKCHSSEQAALCFGEKSISGTWGSLTWFLVATQQVQVSV